MTTTIITTQETLERTMSSFDTVALVDGASIFNSGGLGINSKNGTTIGLDVAIYGDILVRDIAVNLVGSLDGTNDATANHRLFVGRTGSVVSIGNDAVKLIGSGNVVINYGEIVALERNEYAVNSLGEEFELTNFGTITGHRGLNMDGNLGGFSAHVFNGGEIVGVEAGVFSRVALNLENTGTITASSIMSNATGGWGIQIRDETDGGGSRINNSGVIEGQNASIEFNARDNNDNTVINSGHLIGDVIFAYGDDVFDGRGGRVDGTVFGGRGDDSYYIDDASISIFEIGGGGLDTVFSSVSYRLESNVEVLRLTGIENINGFGSTRADKLYGNNGDNVLQGGNGDDLILASYGDDRLFGQEGDDALNGESGDDNLRGGKGSDRLIGGEDDDKLFGGSQDDVLDGSAGNDRLFGGSGDDTISGGLDKDILVGGRGADVFFFKSTTESEVLAFDVIKDFERGVDIVDIAGVPGTLDFIGLNGFSGAGNELRYSVTAKGHSVVRIDLDGDSVADFKLLLRNVDTLDAGDFVL